MQKQAGRVIPVNIEDEVKESYLNYAMSVIVSRALPDVRDGLKPVHRRILYAMSEMGLRYDRTYKKAGRIVGDVLGKYHPHGDQSIYDALVRLAQDFSLRYPVVDGQGNFGSVDGDPPAAMRYTEAKLEKIADFMLRDIKKETVEFGPNYDDSMEEPLLLPAALPFLLINGASGIAVGMATNIPPQNLTEVAAAVIAIIDNPKLTFEELLKIVKGPDFPTAGIIFGKEGIKEAYRSGRGRITVRANVSLETLKNGKEAIIVHELPYQVNKANLIVRIAELVREKKIEGIADLRDESDRAGMRIVIELKRGVITRVVLNQLFMHTQMQINFGVNSLALVGGIPRVLTLREMIDHYILHRKEVVTRRTRFELKKAEERAHILKGLKIALDNIDEVVAIIKASSTVEAARIKLIKQFSLSEKQAQAILDMRLQRLTSLETRKIVDELKEIIALIKHLKDLLSSQKKILGVVRGETIQLSADFGDGRRTKIVDDEVEEINIEDMITKENMVILISNRGLIKRIPMSSYRSQGRGGKGSMSTSKRDNDFIEQIFIASTHDYFLFITSEGKAYWLKVFEIPEATRQSRGQSIKALLSISNNEEITAVLSFRGFNEENYLFMATSRGIVKKVSISDFSNARTRGIIAIKLDKGDKLESALLTRGKDEILLITRHGYALRFHEEAVRATGRSSRGVIGIRLGKNDELTGVALVDDKGSMLLISQYGLGKRIAYDNFITHGRGTRGQICYGVSEKTGEVIGALSVKRGDSLVCITSQGKTIRLQMNEIPVLGKTAMGVRLVRIARPDMVMGIARIAKKRA